MDEGTRERWDRDQDTEWLFREAMVSIDRVIARDQFLLPNDKATLSEAHDCLQRARDRVVAAWPAEKAA